MTIPTVITAPNPPGRKLYFDNNAVEQLLTRYNWTGCTDVSLRNQIMEHADELIRSVIKTHRLHMIGSSGDRTIDELVSEGWTQIELTLYKYRARPHCGDGCYSVYNPGLSALHDAGQYHRILTPTETAEYGLTCPICKRQPSRLIYRGQTKCFNMWSQVSRTVILAFIKKEKRDAKNREGLGQRAMRIGKPNRNSTVQQFITEAEEIFKHDAKSLVMVEALKKLILTDDEPHAGMVGKLRVLAGCSRNATVDFLKMLRLRRDAFTVLDEGRVYPVVGGVQVEQE